MSASTSGVWCGSVVFSSNLTHRKAVSKILGEKKIFSVGLTRKEKIRKISMIKHEDDISQDDKRDERFIAAHQKKITHGIL